MRHFTTRKYYSYLNNYTYKMYMFLYIGTIYFNLIEKDFCLI